MKMHLKMLSAKWQPFCPGWDELKWWVSEHYPPCTSPPQETLSLSPPTLSRALCQVAVALITSQLDIFIPAFLPMLGPWAAHPTHQ